MSHPLPFGVARDQALDCLIGDWVPVESAPAWAGRQDNPSLRPPVGKRGAKPWLFMPVLHASSTGEQMVWKRVM